MFEDDWSSGSRISGGLAVWTKTVEEVWVLESGIPGACSNLSALVSQQLLVILDHIGASVCLTRSSRKSSRNFVYATKA